MSEKIIDIIGLLPLFFCIILTVFIIVRIIRNGIAPVKKVKAVVLEKYTYQPVSRTQGAYNTTNYVIVFQTGKKKLSFNVSEFSYSGYRKKERGMLTYKGDKIISFK